MKKITNCKYELKFDYYVTEDGRVYSDKTKKIWKKVIEDYLNESSTTISEESTL